jgi:broad specificity phosphatase PhoE
VTLFFLIRHAAHDEMLTHLTGRSPGVVLGETGKAQALQLAARLRHERFDAIHTSPRERAIETSQAIAAESGFSNIEPCEDLDEVDFGLWSGRPFADLIEDSQWRRWNAQRSFARPPGGETILDVQRRIMRQIENTALATSKRAVVFVTHAEVIRAALAYCLCLPVDMWQRLEIGPASISRVRFDANGATILGINETIP